MKLLVKWPVVLVGLMALARGTIPKCSAETQVVFTFEGNRGPGWKASANVMGAVGPQQVVDFTVAGFTIHDKATGRTLRHLSQSEFWKQVEPVESLQPHKEANDPWMVYDPVSERWLATAAGTSPAESFLAVSTSSDPAQAWKGVKLPLPQIDPGLKIGVDRNALYISCANGSSNPSEALDLYVIPKADAIASTGPVLSRAQTFSKLLYAAFPAVDLDPDKADDAPAALLNNEFGGPTCSRLYLYKITWSALRANISGPQTIPLSKAYLTPRMEGIQPEGGVRLVEAGGRRNNCAFVRGGSVFGCNGAQRTAQSRPGILWYEVRISDGALLQEGLVDDPACDYLYPSLAVDKLGNIGIGCTRTSATEFPSVCVLMHALGDPPGSMLPPVVALAGTTAFKHAGLAATNFSNYSATCIDPSAAELLWTFQGCSLSSVDRQWCTAWAAFKWRPARSETFTGTAARSGTFKRPLLDVGGKRYELRPSDGAGPEVAELLAKISQGDTGRYAMVGARTTINGGDGILIDSVSPAKADPLSSAPAPANRPGYTIYDQAVKAAPPAEGEHKFRMVIPDGLAVVRGILVVGPYAGGDSRDFHEQAWYREFMSLHGFAFLGAKDFYLHDYSVMQSALEQLAIDTKHPELVNAPYAATGFSAGGGYTRRLMKADPDKVIAGVVVGSTLKLRGEPTDDHRRVPMCVINGELERTQGEGPGMANSLEPVLKEQRPKGALWGWMAVQGVGHELAGQEALSMPILDAAVRLRYPEDADVRKGRVELRPVVEESGWVADNTTWTSGLTAIFPAKEFKGDVAKSSWLLNEDIAFIYRAYSSFDWRLKITSPDPMSAKGEVLEAGSDVTIVVDDTRLSDWRKLELYDGATKVGELSEGPARFLVKDLQPGYHAYSVLGRDTKDNLRPSNPVLVVVRRAP